MAVLLEKIRAEIGARLEESRAAVDEYERLEAALAALGGPIRARRLSPRKAAPVERAVEAPAAEPPVQAPPAEPAAEAPSPAAGDAPDPAEAAAAEPPPAPLAAAA